MSNANKLFFALALAVSAAAFVSQATAQQAQQSARDAAMHKCINQAHREFPGGEDQGPDPRRTFGVTGFLFELAYREGVLCLFGGWSNAPWPGEVHGP